MQTWEIAPPFVELLAESGVIFRQAEVTAIDFDHQKVLLNDQDKGTESLAFDQLVIALGGQTPLPNLPGLKDYGLGFRTLEDAYKLKQKLKSLEQADAEKIRIAIVGGGYSGVELAAKLGDRLGERGRIRIIERGKEILAMSRSSIVNRPRPVFPPREFGWIRKPPLPPSPPPMSPSSSESRKM